MSSLIAIVMAAGHGTRMKSTLPKVLHRAAGRPLVYYPVKAALELGATRVVVVVNPATHEPVATALASELPEAQLSYAVQQVPQGTGDAARVGLAGAGAKDDDVVLVLSGDTPLLTSADLAPLTDALASGRDLAFLSFEPANPHGYGRVVRDAGGAPLAIVEQKDLQGDSQRAIREVNAGMYAARAGVLGRALSGLTNENAQREYYLTDVVRSVAAAGPVVAATVAESAAAGVNQRDELARAEEILYARIRERLGKSGVTVVGRPLIDDSVEIEADALIDDGVRLRGRTRIGAGTHVDVGVVMDDATVGQRCVIKPYCVVSQSSVGDGVQMGPFAHLRPNSVLEDEVHVGNFVETKQTTLRRGAKANHLAYLGDAEVGERANIGAGTIICNYDGFLKQRTRIGARSFIGSDSQLVAPLDIGEDAYVATGTTVVQDVPAGAVAIGRVRQENKLGYAEPLRARLRARAEKEKARKG